MGGFIQFLPLVFVVLVVVSIVRNVLRLMKKMNETSSTPRQPDDYDTAMAERTRRIQDEIRRKIAERRGTTVVTEARPVGSRMEPPEIIEEPPVEPAYVTTSAAVLERQQQLADQMRALELARATEVRRAATANVALKTASESQGGRLASARVELLADLRDPSSLRRAFVLREVLGTPVGLR